MTNEKKFFQSLFNNSYDKKLLFYQLKKNFTFEEQSKIIKNIPKAFETLIYNKPIIKDYSKFGIQKNIVSGSTKTELFWLIHLFKRYSEDINHFLLLKDEFEKSFITGNYKKSSIYLTEIKNISISYWGLENKFLQVQFEKGLEHNINLLNSLNSVDVPDIKFIALTYFFSNKVEEDVSYISFYTRLNAFLNEIKNNVYKTFFNYRLSNISYVNSEENNEILFWYNSNLSIIDQYITYKDIITNLLCENPTIDDEKKIVINKIQENLSTCINDPFFKRLNIFTDNEIDFLVNNKSIEMANLFYEGKFDEVIVKSKELIIDNPLDFNALLYFIKSHLFLSRTIEHVYDNNCIFNKIFDLTYSLLSKNRKNHEIYWDFLTIINKISSLSISKDLIAFVEMNFSTEIEKSLNCNVLITTDKEFIDFNLLTNRNTTRIKYLNHLAKSKLSIASFLININFNVEKDSDGDLSTVNPIFKNYYLALEYYKIGNFNNCIGFLEEGLEKVKNILFFKENCIVLLYECYVKTKQFDRAINLFVENYLINENLTTKIQTKNLIEKIVDSKWKIGDTSNINLPIFIYLSNTEIHTKFIAYDLYMRSQLVNFPSQLTVFNIDNIDSSVFFLRNIANPKIISRKVLVFKSSNDVLAERISICQLLLKIDGLNSKIYNDEISEITKRLTVQQRIKEIDQSKIYVDERGLIESELEEIKKDFKRFLSISELLKSKKIDSYGVGLTSLFHQYVNDEISIDVYKKLRNKSNLHFDLFVDLYINIRDKFLFSNQYGLDYYLSQRIRHGTIIGQLRRHFKEFNLVTTKSSEDKDYLENKFWANKLYFDNDSSKIIFEKRMGEFSNSIDTVINDLKDKYIQIKTEDSKTKQFGWFDYVYIPGWHDQYLLSLFDYLKEVDDFEEFAMTIFEVCWRNTEIILLEIIDKLEKKIKNELIEQLDLLEFDLRKIIPTRNANGIIRAISECRTNIQSDVDYIKRWFSRSKNYEIDFTLVDAYNTSYTIVNNIISPAILNVIININCDVLIKGIYFPHFIDLLKIFLTNVYDYYKQNDMLSNVSNITINQNDNILMISFQNQISENTNIEILKTKIEEIQVELNKKTSFNIRHEGNTGIYKANNIVKYVFRNINNKLTFKIEENSFNASCIIYLDNLAK